MRFGILIGLALYSVIDRNEQAAKQNREKERGLVLIVCSITMIFLCCHLPRYTKYPTLSTDNLTNT